MFNAHKYNLIKTNDFTCRKYKQYSRERSLTENVGQQITKATEKPWFDSNIPASVHIIFCG